MASPPHCPMDCFPVVVELFSKDRCDFGWVVVVGDDPDKLLPVARSNCKLPLGFLCVGSPDGIIIVKSGVHLVEPERPFVV